MTTLTTALPVLRPRYRSHGEKMRVIFVRQALPHILTALALGFLLVTTVALFSSAASTCSSGRWDINFERGSGFHATCVGVSTLASR
jgi:ABC-type antimicrobial peptide transport system permease subunit